MKRSLIYVDQYPDDMKSVDTVDCIHPAFRSNDILGAASSCPLLVVTSITPADALAPYTAAADASLRIDTLSISFALIRARFISTPSTSMRGEPPLIDVTPRMLIDALASGPPDPILRLSEGSAPCSAVAALPVGRPLISLAFTTVTAPVRLTFFCCP